MVWYSAALRLIFCVLSSAAISVLAQSPAGSVLVKDINPGDASSYVRSFARVNNRLVFYAVRYSIDGIWSTDGTETGTVFVAATETFLPVFTNAAGQLLFVATDGLVGEELWSTDGRSGKTLIKDIRLGPEDSNPRNFIRHGTNIFFVANDGVHGNALWKTDCTSNGTVLVSEINTGSPNPGPENLMFLNDLLFFSVYDSSTGEQLWKSDGTAAGTGRFNSFGTRPEGVVSNWLLFTGCDSTNGCELWRTDGTTAGTSLVKDIWPGPSSGGPGYSSVVLSNVLYFFGYEPTHGGELWKSDGTPEGTVFVKDCRPGPLSSNPEGPGLAIAYNGKVFFSADNGSFRELWRSDGTEAGTTRVQPETGEILRAPYNFEIVDGLLYFTAWPGRGQTDGSDAGTRVVLPNTPLLPGVFSNHIYFAWSNEMTGSELWKLDVQRRPQLRRALRSGPDLTFEIVSRANGTVVIESSDDLQLWRPIQTNAVPDTGKFLFSAPRGGAQQFYRAHDSGNPVP